MKLYYLWHGNDYVDSLGNVEEDHLIGAFSSVEAINTFIADTGLVPKGESFTETSRIIRKLVKVDYTYREFWYYNTGVLDSGGWRAKS